MYCYRSRNGYFMVRKLRNCSTTTEATMTTFTCSCRAISLGANPKKLSSFTGYWDIRPERQAPKGLNSYFFHLVLFYLFFLLFINTTNLRIVISLQCTFAYISLLRSWNDYIYRIISESAYCQEVFKTFSL